MYGAFCVQESAGRQTLLLSEVWCRRQRSLCVSTAALVFVCIRRFDDFFYVAFLFFSPPSLPLFFSKGGLRVDFFATLASPTAFSYSPLLLVV